MSSLRNLLANIAITIGFSTVVYYPIHSFFEKNIFYPEIRRYDDSLELLRRIELAKEDYKGKRLEKNLNSAEDSLRKEISLMENNEKLMNLVSQRANRENYSLIFGSAALIGGAVVYNPKKARN